MKVLFVCGDSSSNFRLKRLVNSIEGVDVLIVDSIAGAIHFIDFEVSDIFQVVILDIDSVSDSDLLAIVNYVDKIPRYKYLPVVAISRLNLDSGEIVRLFKKGANYVISNVIDDNLVFLSFIKSLSNLVAKFREIGSVGRN
jgi:hypothetical protein